MAYGRADEFVEVNGTAMIETELAVAGDFGGDGLTWFPKSQLEDWPDLMENGDFLIPRWLAEEKGVI